MLIKLPNLVCPGDIFYVTHPLDGVVLFVLQSVINDGQYDKQSFYSKPEG